MNYLPKTPARSSHHDRALLAALWLAPLVACGAGEGFNVMVAVNAGLSVPEFNVSCTGCDPACSVGDNPCTGSQVGVFRRDMPGPYKMLIWTNGGLYGWMLELEIDLDSGKARACRLPVSDVVGEAKKQGIKCATSGTIELAQEPTAQVLQVAGKFDLSFADGLKIQGQFTTER